ncbi:MAG: hypothetical protein E6G03_11800 [Actinobacteria bacterium]|nr:MAG: hypothetical protein E6G03_11800 [Actinomycetota bacterium]
MASAPDGLTLKRHRDMEGRHWWVYVRRVLLSLLGAVLVLGLLNVFGQRPKSSTANAPAASLKVYAPVHARSGVVYAARFHITAHRDLKDAFLVLDPGWAEGYTVNGLAPQPLTEADRNGRIAYGFGHIPAGQSLIFFLSLQVNPTNVGRHSQNVELDDGETPILTVHRKVTIFP